MPATAWRAKRCHVCTWDQNWRTLGRWEAERANLTTVPLGWPHPPLLLKKTGKKIAVCFYYFFLTVGGRLGFLSWPRKNIWSLWQNTAPNPQVVKIIGRIYVEELLWQSRIHPVSISHHSGHLDWVEASKAKKFKKYTVASWLTAWLLWNCFGVSQDFLKSAVGAFWFFSKMNNL